MDDSQIDGQLIENALRSARDTRQVLIGHGMLREVAGLCGTLFNQKSCLLVADENTFAAAGRAVYDTLRSLGFSCRPPLVLDPTGLYAEYSVVTQVREWLEEEEGVPIAVGSGTINDLVKLASHQCGRQYLSVATAPSMDGYTAYGSSITYQGSKQTFDCPAPLGVVADLDVICAAPSELGAAGYGDLLAKCPAGADWILADGLDVDPIDRRAWEMVQERLSHWMANPAGIRVGQSEAMRQLTVALMMTGFAMQSSLSSRPASGAEHMFSHLWDMEKHKHNDAVPSHGFKVAIGSLASLRLYEAVLAADLENVDIPNAVSAWPDEDAIRCEIDALFGDSDLARKAHIESGSKHIGPDRLEAQLMLLSTRWADLRTDLARQLLLPSEAEGMLREAGCPTHCEEIGISIPRLQASYRKAYHIRRRFTVLDLALRINRWDELVETAVSAMPQSRCT